ncbi:MAG TPA: deoxynucleoside kinase [Gammaproteobacteria bacterium]|nr:deoxynucleoside kinase [Gammaproteobacteria bacterium]
MSTVDIPRYIVIEGPIGVGKTSLAKRLAEDFGGELLLEGAEENPFLARFYRNPRHAALPTQLFFLFQRAQQIQALRQSDMFAPIRVADFILEKDRLFAQLTLDDDELQLYEQVYNNITVDAPQPDLVIYLQAPVDVLLNRVQKRGREYERFIETNYLERLVEAYTRFFHHYSATPLLIVNAAAIDLVNNQQDYQLLVERLHKATSGRHYFNPGSFDL